MIMRCTPIVTGLVLTSIVFATVSAQAQVSIDRKKQLNAAAAVFNAIKFNVPGRKEKPKPSK
jgi:hypothetical protein